VTSFLPEDGRAGSRVNPRWKPSDGWGVVSFRAFTRTVCARDKVREFTTQSSTVAAPGAQTSAAEVSSNASSRCSTVMTHAASVALRRRHVQTDFKFLRVIPIFLHHAASGCWCCGLTTRPVPLFRSDAFGKTPHTPCLSVHLELTLLPFAVHTKNFAAHNDESIGVKSREQKHLVHAAALDLCALLREKFRPVLVGHANHLMNSKQKCNTPATVESGGGASRKTRPPLLRRKNGSRGRIPFAAERNGSTD